ncbi:MAG TPA: glycosyltransferase family 4 protein [Syntrophorhabdaceae bacterium]|nr:glycosyltransferase family 4 protein [Syntrophorhabdaceae bacterium]
MKKAVFLTHANPQGYRIQQYFPFLEKKGFNVELITTKTGFIKMIPFIKNADVVYIQRLLFEPIKLSLIRRISKRLVYDFDDAVMYGPKGESPTRMKKFKNMVTKADAVLCGNRFLLNEAIRYKEKNVFYCPTVVDLEEYPVKEHKDNMHVVIGWIGSKSTVKYFSTMEDVFLRAKEKIPHIRYKIIADYAPETKIDYIFEKWDKKKEKEGLLSFDIGIMPLWNDIWSRGKCGLKLIQYMAAGLPTISHPVGAVLEIIEDGLNGFIREDSDEWMEAILTLTKDVSLRKKMGSTARKTVQEKYSLQKWGPMVANILDNL